jgi:NAD(P)H-hydrate epimerase
LGPAQTELVGHIVEHCEIPVALDADALTVVSGNLRRFRLAKGPRVLLPHRGEMARLLQCTTVEIDQDPLGAMAQLSELTHAIVVLKGAYTFVSAPGKKPMVLGTPCPVLATGGTGDVLAGMTGALLVDHEPLAATLLAVHLHSRAGALWAESHGADRGLLAGELADLVPKALAELSQPKSVLTE